MGREPSSEITRRLRRAHCGGFSLLETLIALLVLSIGLLGVAGLQIAGLRSNQSSLQTSQAAALAYEIADRMRANPLAARTGGYRLVAGLPGEIEIGNPASNCRSGRCASSELASIDIYEWRLRVVSSLPRSTSSITCADPCDAGSLQSVTVFWDLNRSGASGTACTDDPAIALDTAVNLSCVRIGVQP